MIFNMKMLCIVLAVVQFSIVDGGTSVLTHPTYPSTITKFNIEGWRPDGYSFEYETSSGSSRKERGYLKKDSSGNDQLVTEGEYSYIDDRNQLFTVRYVADENGYHPTINRQMSKNTIITPTVRKLDNGGDFVFPDDDNVIITTDKPSRIVPTTSLPTSTEENPFTTTLLPEEDDSLLANRVDLSPDLIASLLGG